MPAEPARRSHGFRDLLRRFLPGAPEDPERRRLQEAIQALAEAERLHAALLANSWDILSILDRQGNLVYNSPAAFRVHGFRDEEMLGRNTLELIHPEDRDRVAQTFQTLLASPGSTGLVQYRYACKDGRWVDMEAVAVNYLDDPNVRGIIVNSREITERLASERALRGAAEERRRMESKLWQAQKMESLGSLAAGVAHDFNNMLGGIIGFTDLLLASEPDPGRREALQSILRAAQHSSELTRKLLAFGRRGKNVLEAVDLNALAREVSTLLLPSLAQGTTLQLDAQPVPSVDADPSLLNQMILHLLVNANEAMRNPGRIRLCTRTERLEAAAAEDLGLPEGDYAVLAVQDEGVGMDEETQRQVFEPFFTTKAEGAVRGSGLGLSTVYGIVQSHHGAVRVESALGRGSTFTTWLPSGSLRAAEPNPGAAPIKGRGTILVVDDEPVIVNFVVEALQREGYATLSARDGLEGASVFAASHAELGAVILDLKMPRLGGSGCFERMQQVDPTVPVLVCTGYGDNEEVQSLLRRGARGLLKKPFRLAELTTWIHTLLPRD